MMLKAVAFVAAGLVVGFALGGIPARRELAVAREQRDALEAKLERLARPNLLQAFLPGLDGPARLDATEPETPSPAAGEPLDERARAPGDVRPPPRGDVAVIGSAERAGGTGPRPAPNTQRPVASGGERTARAEVESEADSPPAERGRRSGRNLLARFDQLVTAQRTRSAAARSALVEQTGLGDEQLERFDSAVTRMNGKLAGYGEEVIAQAASEEPPSPAQALGLGHDVSGILYEAQKELDGVVGEQADAIDPSALEIWNYVDVEQWRPYVEAQLASRTTDEGGERAADGAAGAAASPAQPAR
jgi:hypothetical protein